MDTTYIVKSKITKFEFSEESSIFEHLSKDLISRYTNNGILTLPKCFLIKDDKLYWKAKIEIFLEKDNSVTKYFESDQDALDYIKAKFSNIETIEI